MAERPTLWPAAQLEGNVTANNTACKQNVAQPVTDGLTGHVAGLYVVLCNGTGGKTADIPLQAQVHMWSYAQDNAVTG
eukprot:220054-Chlamydomonas_euryale.AAC.5